MIITVSNNVPTVWWFQFYHDQQCVEMLHGKKTLPGKLLLRGWETVIFNDDSTSLNILEKLLWYMDLNKMNLKDLQVACPCCTICKYKMLLGLKINSRKFFIRLTQLRISAVLEWIKMTIPISLKSRGTSKSAFCTMLHIASYPKDRKVQLKQ